MNFAGPPAALDLPPHAFALAHFRAQWGDCADVALADTGTAETARLTLELRIANETVCQLRQEVGNQERLIQSLMQGDGGKMPHVSEAAPPAAEPTGASE